MTQVSLKGLLAAALMTSATVAGTTAATAGDDALTLANWSAKASEVVFNEMDYPRLAYKNNQEGAVRYRVTVNRAGDVVSAEAVELPRGVFLRTAARRLVEKADFPALPAAYAKDELTFALALNYSIASSASEYRALQKEFGAVSGQQIAQSASTGGAPYFASIQILDTAE